MLNIRSIWDNQKPTGKVIIKTKINDIPYLNCYAATNNITGQYIYIMSVSKDILIPEFRNYRFKGVEIFLIEESNAYELNIYLLDNDLKAIFSLFIQNILEEIYKMMSEEEAIIRTIEVISKWKKLFDKIGFEGLSMERQKGLIGELLFINLLLDSNKNSYYVLNAWTGSDFGDKDFIFGPIGVEIKFTSSKNPNISITSERQLDTQNIEKLFLVLYTAEEVKENGFTLNTLIKQIRQKLSMDPNTLGFFNEKLFLLGYFDEDTEHYNKMFSIKKTFNYIVSSDFPQINKSSTPLGIYNISYSIELSAIESFITEIDNIIQIIR